MPELLVSMAGHAETPENTFGIAGYMTKMLFNDYRARSATSMIVHECKRFKVRDVATGAAAS